MQYVSSYVSNRDNMISILYNIVEDSKIPLDQCSIILSIISIDSQYLYIDKLAKSLQQYHLDLANDFIISLGSTFDTTTFDTSRDLSMQLVDAQSKSNKFKKLRLARANAFNLKLISIQFPNFTKVLRDNNDVNITCNILSHELDKFTFHNILKSYELSKGIHADNIFVVASFAEFKEYKLSNKSVHSSNVNYFICGYCIAKRLKSAMTDRYLRIPIEIQPLIRSFLDYTFYNESDKVNAYSEIGDSTILIKIIEKFNGLMYAKIEVFEWYEYLAFCYYKVMSLSNIIIFHRDEPNKKIKEMLLGSVEIREMFSLIFNDSHINNEFDDELKDLSYEFAITFIISGIVNIQNKSQYNKKMINFLKKDANFAGIRPACVNL